jgi:hypothetical protein
MPFRSTVLAALLLVAGLSRATAQSPIPDTPFSQDYHEAYPLATPAENDVRAVAFDAAGNLFAATGAGVRCLDAGHWKAPEGGIDLGPTHTLYLDPEGALWVGAWNGLYRVTPERVTPAGIEGTPISAITSRKNPDGTETLFAAGPDGIRRRDHGAWTLLAGNWQSIIGAILPADGDRLWIGTASGLYLQDLSGAHPATVRYGKPDVLLSSYINALRPLPDGTTGIASTGGIDLYRGTKRVLALSAQQGMPNRQARSLVSDPDGRLWIATKLGVIRYDHGRWSLRNSRRWLSSDDARDVAIGPDGTAWVATAAGVDAIRRRQMTLADKAGYYLQMLRARHIRPPGFVGPAVLLTPGDLSRSFIEDDDNDGEHTGEYLAMESMRYAVTKDPAARANAKVAFHALVALREITGTDYFIARAMLPIETPPRHEVERTFTPEEIAETHRTQSREKIIEKRWVPSADGKWLWKRDASSDEVDGHMFGYSTYYDLAADDDEKRLVADQVDRLIGGILDHGYLLQDIDGKGTRWANWSPASLNGDANWNEERPGNSVELIAYLGVAYHITGKQRYLDAARTLITKDHYDRNMLATRYSTPAEHSHVVDQLLATVYPNLFTHLPLPSLQQTALTSIRRWHEGVVKDGIPLYDFVYNRFSGRETPLAGAVEQLRDWPLDMIEWTVDNSKREDVQPDLTPGQDEGLLTRILPRSEMGLCMWDQEPYRAVIGRDGQREDRPNDWLLAYWMGRYYGLLAAPAP